MTVTASTVGTNRIAADEGEPLSQIARHAGQHQRMDPLAVPDAGHQQAGCQVAIGEDGKRARHADQGVGQAAHQRPYHGVDALVRLSSATVRNTRQAPADSPTMRRRVAISVARSRH